MSRPSRNSDAKSLQTSTRTFFVTTKTHQGKNLLQSEQHAMLLVDTLRNYAAQRRFEIHDFVIMLNHVHILLSIDDSISIERAMQLIKGRFSYRLRTELGYQGEVWQKGFSEVRVYTDEHFEKCREYIEQNPMKAGIVAPADTFPFCCASLVRKKSGAEAPS